MWLPVRPGLSFFALAALLTAAASGLLSVGCSSSSAPAGTICGGVESNGKCLAKCDEKTDCQGTDRCVVAPNHPEGQCFPVCQTSANCQLDYECRSATPITGSDMPSVCVSASILGLTPGQPGDMCADDSGCDHGLSCLGSVCAYGCAQQGDCPAQLSVGGMAQGVYCDPTTKSCKPNGLAVGTGESGSPCASPSGCDAHHGLTCVNGQCGVMPPGKLGQACSDADPCVAGLGCFNMVCRSPCKSVTSGSCGAGMQCMPVAGPDYQGLCIEAPMQSGMGQYGSSCPNPAKTPCDTASGFVCIGAPGIGSGRPTHYVAGAGRCLDAGARPDRPGAARP